MEIVGYEVCEAGSPLALDKGEFTSETIQNLSQGFEGAYVNGSLASNYEYRPGFVSNNPEGKYSLERYYGE